MNNLLASLKAAYLYQHEDGPQPNYSTLRILEKKRLIFIYQRLNEWSSYHAPTHKDKCRLIKRRTIYTVIVLHNGKMALRQANLFD